MNPENAALATATVVSVRISLLAVAIEPEQGFADAVEYTLANREHGAFDDGRRRLVVSKTIQLRNSRIS